MINHEHWWPAFFVIRALRFFRHSSFARHAEALAKAGASSLQHILDYSAKI
jgi:hypothetical protein